MAARCRPISRRSSVSPAVISPTRCHSSRARPPTGAQKVGFQAADQFLNLMLDPFVDGRSGIGAADHPALGFAPDQETLPDDIALAYSKVLKGPPKAVPLYEPRWTVWGGAYGGSNRTTGDLAVTGSHDLSARTAGLAGGFDYRLTPDTVVGLAFAGGGTDWSLAQGWAVAEAMPSRPASMAPQKPARLTSPPPWPSPTTGCPPTVLPSATT
jgi:hypothetical protein